MTPLDYPLLSPADREWAQKLIGTFTGTLVGRHSSSARDVRARSLLNEISLAAFSTPGLTHADICRLIDRCLPPRKSP